MGTVMEAHISSLSRFGIFTVLDATGTSALLPMSALPQDQWHHDEKTQTLLSRDKTMAFRPGQALRVRIEEACAIRGTVLLALPDTPRLQGGGHEAPPVSGHHPAPHRHGRRGAATWRRRISTLGHIPRDTFILLLVIARLTTAACADDVPAAPAAPHHSPLQADSVDTTDGAGMDPAVISSVMQASLAFLQPRTLENHEIHDFALWGLNGLSALDPSLSIEEQHGFLQLTATQKTVLALPVPATDDVPGWSAAITRILDVAWHHSAAMRSTGADGVLQGFFDELFNHLDPYSRYIPPQAAVSDRSTRTGGEATAGLTLGWTTMRS
ncbi:S1 RNA-binding domain-containing protein [Komagataeibacter rhaeticus]|nr:S1 RNA-binding domain-containing protein [Komagataeibacter rhaeticus]